MLNFLWHGLECFIWCGVWHKLFHWWEHFTKPSIHNDEDYFD